MVQKLLDEIYSKAKNAKSLEDMSLTVEQVEEILDSGDALVGTLKIFLWNNKSSVEFKEQLEQPTTEEEAFELMVNSNHKQVVIYYALYVIGEQNAVLKSITESLRSEIERAL